MSPQTTRNPDLYTSVFYVPEIFELIANYCSTEELAVLVKVSKRLFKYVSPLLYKHVCFHGSKNYTSVYEFLKSVNPRYNPKQNYLSIISNLIKNQDLSGVLSRKFNKLFSNISPRKQCKNSCCEINRKVSDFTSPRSFLIPSELSADNHRFKSAVYGIIPKITSKAFYTQHNYSAKPCLQLCTPSFKTWTVEKAQQFQTYGPFVNSLAITNMDLDQDIFSSLFKYMSNLSVVTISSCPGMKNKALKIMCENSSEKLIRLSLCDLPDIDDLGIYYVGKNCPNLEYIDLTDCINITEGGIRELLVMCPFVHTLILNRFGFGKGFTINEKIIPYLPPYGISLKRLGVAGCSLGEKEILVLIEKCRLMKSWMFDMNQLGTKKIKGMKLKITIWFKSSVVYDC